MRARFSEDIICFSALSAAAVSIVVAAVIVISRNKYTFGSAEFLFGPEPNVKQEEEKAKEAEHTKTIYI